MARLSPLRFASIREHAVNAAKQKLAEGKLVLCMGLRQAAAAACTKHGKALGVGGIRGDSELQRELVQLGGLLR
jgi:hypothetical protein